MKTALVTGSAGFIGNRLAELLLDEGIYVVGLDNINDAYDRRLKKNRLTVLESRDNYTFYEADLENRDELKTVFDNHSFEAVYNLGARAGVRYSIEDPHVYMRSNAQGALNILELMQKYDCPKLVLASTSSLYAGQPMPFHEELTVDRPLSPYAASKKAAEAMSHAYHHVYGIDVTITRYFTVYGPACRPDMAPFRFIKSIHGGTPITVSGDGSQTRDFTYIDDIARGTLLASKPLGFEIINLGGGKRPVSIMDFIRKIEDRLGKRAEIIWEEMAATEMTDTSADIRKAKELLDWEPLVDLDEGLDKTIDWYLQNLDWVKDIEL
jgi:nucleoside-diphosphate-sugar epimerase